LHSITMQEKLKALEETANDADSSARKILTVNSP
jgi:hypothetical protein